MPESDTPQQTPKIEVAAFYKFARLAQVAELQSSLQEVCDRLGICGILLVAQEGINGTLAGTPPSMREVMSGIKNLTGLHDLDWKTSYCDEMPFLRMKVRLKQEIVTIGDLSVDPLKQVGTYVEPEDWNALISDPDVVLIDTRNAFEVAIGTFKGAIDPKTDTFSQFPEYVRTHLDPSQAKKVAMFCTGGIRCEKATSLMLAQGFEEVYHLKGGILKYLEQVPEDESLWSGACFVFDQRVAVGHGLGVEDISACFGCRAPLSEEDRHSSDYEEGVCCPHCAPRLSLAQKASARERHKQIKLAEARGGQHLGPKAQVRG